MNERIRELATKAGYKDFDYAIIAHKFAELLVRECVQVCINEGKTYAVKSAGEYQAELFSNAIKKHFGVEEHKGWVCTKCGVDRTKDVCPLGHTAAITGECPMTAEAQ